MKTLKCKEDVMEENYDSQREWEEKVDAFRASGQMASTWCKEQGENYRHFLYHRHKIETLRKRSQEPDSPFVELAQEKEDSSESAGITLVCKGIILNLNRNFHEATLTRCLRVLEELPC